MSLPRFFILPDQIHNSLVTLMGGDVRHINRVLRLGIGDFIECLDGRGHLYRVKLSHLESEQIIGEIVESYKVDSEPELQVTIAQGIPKGERWDFVLQKCSELGATVFQPLYTERTIVRIDEDQLPRKLERWSKIAQEAAEQSQRSVIPRILAPITLEHWLTDLTGFDLVVLAWENEEQQSLKEVYASLPELKRLALLIGPEGGFSLKEVEQVRQAGGRPVSIGPRILRSETAAITLLALSLYHFGDMGDR
ncbi:MAG: 16S rRNA (uracil(1498)-N(3))-methyltransferase [Symbiobacteriaceae bacterium]|nr:16S rRNA (uracil(1498)-N(3))-methyltransferase [Symbiobacteriaceae bacterium]